MGAFNTSVRLYWDRQVCGTAVAKGLPERSREWFARIEQHRYTAEPFIPAVAKFAEHRGKALLEIGVGAGTDHLQFARAGALCHGVDLTDHAIHTTRAHLAHHGVSSTLQRIEDERLPFPDASFDVVYSWGVIHHTEDVPALVQEIIRVLKPGGRFIGMVYSRHALVVLKLWIKYGLLRGRPFIAWSDLVSQHMESPGTKAYSIAELHALFGGFRVFQAKPVLTPYDLTWIPRWMRGWFSDAHGFFITMQAQK